MIRKDFLFKLVGPWLRWTSEFFDYGLALLIYQFSIELNVGRQTSLHNFARQFDQVC